MEYFNEAILKPGESVTWEIKPSRSLTVVLADPEDYEDWETSMPLIDIKDDADNVYIKTISNVYTCNVKIGLIKRRS